MGCFALDPGHPAPRSTVDSHPGPAVAPQPPGTVREARASAALPARSPDDPRDGGILRRRGDNRRVSRAPSGRNRVARTRDLRLRLDTEWKAEQGRVLAAAGTWTALEEHEFPALEVPELATHGGAHPVHEQRESFPRAHAPELRCLPERGGAPAQIEGVDGRAAQAPYIVPEAWASGGGIVGRIDIHFQGANVYGTLCTTADASEERIQALIDETDERLVMTADPYREDFIVTVWRGSPAGVYSDQDSDEDDDDTFPLGDLGQN